MAFINTKTLSTKEMKNLIGRWNYYNPFLSFRSKVLKITRDKTDAFSARALWSASTYYRDYELKVFLQRMLAFFITFYIMFNLYAMENFPHLEGMLNWTTQFSICIFSGAAALFLSVMSSALMTSSLSAGTPLNIFILSTGHHDIDAISRMDIFVVIEKLKLAGFSDSEIGELNRINSECHDIKNFRNKCEELKAPVLSIGHMANYSVMNPKLKLNAYTENLINRASIALGIRSADQIIDVQNDKMIVSHDGNNFITTALRHAGIGKTELFHSEEKLQLSSL